MHTRGARTVRGMIAALTATFVAAFFHTIADGLSPSAFGVVVALAFAIPACVFLAGRSLSRTRLAVSVLASQAVFHLAMSLGDGSGVTASSDAGAGHHAHAASVTLTAAAVGTPHAPHDTAMWLGHLFAAALTFALLRRGEAAFWAILALTSLTVTRLLLMLTESAHLPPVRARATARPRSIRPRLVVLSTMRHRGPPLVCA
jgi:hypothetical protein